MNGDAGSLMLVASGLVLATGSAVILTTLLPLIRRGWWWVRIWDFPRAQNALIGPLVLVLGFVVLPGGAPTTIFLGVVGACSAWQIWWVWPFTRLAPHQMLDASEDATHRIKVLVTNVEIGNRNAPAVIDAVRRTRPDLWLALETDAWWCERLGALDHLFEYGCERPQDNAYGLLFRSRLPPRDARVRDLVETRVPSLHACVVLPSGEEISFHGVHPRPPHTFQASFGRDGELMVIARMIARDDGPTIVAGDFNDVPWSRTCRMFQKVARLLDPRIGRGLVNTFNARRRVSRWPLDHVFASEHFRLVRMASLEPVGSDHYPLLVELAYQPEGAAEQEPHAMHESDHTAAEALLKRRERVH